MNVSSIGDSVNFCTICDKKISSTFFSLFSINENVRKPNSKYRTRTNYAHIIHPAFKKRSIDDMTPLEKFDLKVHRNSRHALYKQINTFLKTYILPHLFFSFSVLSETHSTKFLFRFFSFVNSYFSVGKAAMAMNAF